MGHRLYLVTEGCQIGRRLLSHSTDLSSRNQSKNILRCQVDVSPELVPEHILRGLYGLQNHTRVYFYKLK